MRTSNVGNLRQVAFCVTLSADKHDNVLTLVSINIFWDATHIVTGHEQAWHYDPPEGYEYQWSGDEPGRELEHLNSGQW